MRFSHYTRCHDVKKKSECWYFYRKFQRRLHSMNWKQTTIFCLKSFLIALAVPLIHFWPTFSKKCLVLQKLSCVAHLRQNSRLYLYYFFAGENCHVFLCKTLQPLARFVFNFFAFCRINLVSTFLLPSWWCLFDLFPPLPVPLSQQLHPSITLIRVSFTTNTSIRV